VLRTKGTSITKHIDVATSHAGPTTNWIKFTDFGIGEGTLDQYLLGRYAGGSRASKYRPIGTSENEVCLFPVAAPVRLCYAVASLFSR